MSPTTRETADARVWSRRVKIATTTSATNHHHGRTAPAYDEDNGQGSRHFAQKSRARALFLALLSRIWRIQLDNIHYALHVSSSRAQDSRTHYFTKIFIPALLTRRARVLGGVLAIIQYSRRARYWPDIDILMSISSACSSFAPLAAFSLLLHILGVLVI